MTTNKNNKKVAIPKPQLEKLIVTIKGESPLITNKFGEKAKAEIEAKQQGKAKNKKGNKNPEELFKSRIYYMNKEKTKYGFPAIGVKKSLIRAGGNFTDDPMTKLRTYFTIPCDLLEIKGSEPEMRSDRVNVGRGSLDIRYRPQFWPWEMEVPIIYNTSVFTREKLLYLFQMAGFGVGIGDWRVSCDGVFGQFSIKEAIVANDEEVEY